MSEKFNKILENFQKIFLNQFKKSQKFLDPKISNICWLFRSGFPIFYVHYTTSTNLDAAVASQDTGVSTDDLAKQLKQRQWSRHSRHTYRVLVKQISHASHVKLAFSLLKYFQNM